MTRYVLITHEVVDYPAWKQIFDESEGMRQTAGEIGYQLFTRESHENLVVHLSRWTSLEAARNFFESDELVEVRRRAGVIAPEFVYLDPLETSPRFPAAE